jgi:vacuolar protein sorting-associated protein 35
MKCSKHAAKIVKKPEQCEIVSMCSHLFYVVDASDDTTVVYSNPQRCLECLQRGLKLADACTTSNPANLQLFVDLLELYLYFFEKKNPKVTANYITGLAALIKEHTNTLGQFGSDTPVGAAKAHFFEIVRYIKRTQSMGGDKAEQFKEIDVNAVQT